MDFQYTEQQQMIREMVREFAEQEIKPLAKEVDEKHMFPVETVKKMQEMGLFGLAYPEEYGGSGAGQVAYMLAVEEIAKVCATTSVILSASESLGTWPISKFGTEEQKQRWLVPVCKGEKLAASEEEKAGFDRFMELYLKGLTLEKEAVKLFDN